MIEIDGNSAAAAFILTAAGSSRRMGGGLKKEFRTIGGVPVLAMALRALLDTGIFDYGIITHPEGMEEQMRELVNSLGIMNSGLKAPLGFCEGGRERQNSVMNGLTALENILPDSGRGSIVLIHDGARPWLSPETAVSVAETALRYGASAPVVPSVDAMKEIDTDGIITNHLPRKTTVSIQTPQGFGFRDIIDAHRSADNDGCCYIDDTEIYSRYCGPVRSVAGSVRNRKITYKSDLGERI